jgi:hypothetical protein
MWQQTWKAKTTPLRRRILAHTASARSTSASGSTGWPTPDASACNSAGDTTWQDRRQAMKAKHGNGNGFGLTLGQASTLASWATPTRSDHQGAASPEAVKEWASRGHNLPEQAQMAAWATPGAGDDRGANPRWQEAAQRHAAKGQHKQMGLRDQCRLSAWPTPQEHVIDAKKKPPIMEGRKATDPQIGLADVAVHLTPGAPSNGSSAATARPGQLNPAFSLWLMGYEMAAWLLAAPSDKAQPRSAKPKRSTDSAASAS